jgi:hypothetical protein
MTEIALIGFDGEIVSRTSIDEPLPTYVNRPVAAPLSLEQLRRMTSECECGGIDEGDPLPSLPGDLDDERERLPSITVEEYRRETMPHEMERGIVFYRRIR